MGLFGRVFPGLMMAAGLMGLAASAEASQMAPSLNAFAVSHGLQSRDGDFDGDGTRDALFLVNEPDSDRVAVHVRLNKATGAEDVRVTSLDGHASAASDLRVVAAGQYVLDCGSFSDSCGAHTVEALNQSLIIGLEGGLTVLVHWQGDHFEQDFVRSDDAVLARALSGLYASNR